MASSPPNRYELRLDSSARAFPLRRFVADDRLRGRPVASLSSESVSWCFGLVFERVLLVLLDLGRVLELDSCCFFVTNTESRARDCVLGDRSPGDSPFGIALVRGMSGTDAASSSDLKSEKPMGCMLSGRALGCGVEDVRALPCTDIRLRAAAVSNLPSMAPDLSSTVFFDCPLLNTLASSSLGSRLVVLVGNRGTLML